MNQSRTKYLSSRIFVLWLPLLLALLLAGSGMVSQAEVTTNVGGPIFSNTTWTLANSPYLATNSVQVMAGATLTIEPGVIVRFDAGKALSVSGGLVARGTAQSPITFTANTANPTPGFWGFIKFENSSTDATFDGDGNYTGGSIIQHAVVEYAGSDGNNPASIFLDRASPLIDQNTVRHNGNDGIRLWESSAIVSGNWVEDSQGYGLITEYGQSSILNNTVVASSDTGIYAREGVLVEGNTVRGGSYFYASGIACWSTTVRYNRVYANAGIGIHAPNDCDVINNVIAYNGNDGINTDFYLIHSPGNGAIIGNKFAHNATGIRTLSPSAVTHNSIVFNGSDASVVGVEFQSSGANCFAYNTVVGQTSTSNTGTGGLYLRGGNVDCQVQHNNIYGNQGYELYNNNRQSDGTVDAQFNWWGTTDGTTINNEIYDFFDDGALAVTNYGNMLTAPDTDAPPAPPTGFQVAVSGSNFNLSWNANAEVDIAGYRVYYDFDGAYPYEGSGATQGVSGINVGKVTSYSLSGLPTGRNIFFTVLAYDTSGDEWVGESWYALGKYASIGDLPLRNGNFDLGPNGDWSESGGLGAFIHQNSLPVTPHSGSYVAWLGSVNDANELLSQTVTVPAGGDGNLHFFYQIMSEDSCGYDFANVLVNDVVVSSYDLCDGQITGDWMPAAANVISYTGQVVNLAFQVMTDGSSVSTFLIDDVSWTAPVLSTATPTATPTPTEQPNVLTFENMSRDGLRFAYVITNTANIPANVVHSFSANGISTDFQMNSVIPAAGSQAVLLATLPLPPGWQGTVWIQADQPITGTVAIRPATPTPTTVPPTNTPTSTRTTAATNTPSTTPTTTAGGLPTIYWINNTTRTIQWFVVGTGHGNLLPFSSGQAGNNIRIDKANGKIYWAESRTVKRANLDGSGVETLATVADVMGNVFPDAAHGKVYYVRRYGIDDDLRRMNLDGSGDELLFTFHPTTNLMVSDIWIDGANGYIYWANTNGNTSIERANLDGSGRQTVVAPAGTNPMRMQLDLGNGKIYWTDNSMSTSIQRANLDGTGKQVLVNGVNVPSGFDLDLANGKMYWADGVQGGLIQSANLDGSGRATLVGPLGVSSFTDLPGLAVGLPAGSSTPTATTLPPTATPTATTLPPTATSTATTLPPTATPTATTLPPTATPTATTLPPTATPTATTLPPTNTPTATTQAPTNTPTATVVQEYLQVFSITPGEGDRSSATNVVILGQGFQGTPDVKLGSYDLGSVSRVSSQQLTAVVPPGLPLGTHDLLVSNPDGETVILAQAFTVVSSGPAIAEVRPSQGVASIANTINVYGFNFDPAALVKLGNQELPTTFIGGSYLQAEIPAGVAPGPYDVTVQNPGNVSALKPNAYTAIEGGNDDLYSYNSQLWTDPVAPRAAQAADVGLVVNRQGGKQVLSNVPVNFYVGDSIQNGQSLGTGTILLLSPRSSISTSAVKWTPATPGSYTLWAQIDPNNSFAESLETNNIVSRTLTVLGQSADEIAPHVDTFGVNGGASQTVSQTVQFNTSASDPNPSSGLKSLLFQEYEYSQSSSQWVPVKNSGWLDYETARTNHNWTLLPNAGVKYLQAWVSDRAGNVSLFPFRAFINYGPPTDRVGTDQVRVYRYELKANDVLTAQIDPVSGDPDLYVWPPDAETRPPKVSNLSGDAIEGVSWEVPVAGVYQVEVYGYAASEYRLTVNITPAAQTRQADAVGGEDPNKTKRSQPLIGASNTPGNQQALPTAPTAPDAPAAAQMKVFLPAVTR